MKLSAILLATAAAAAHAQAPAPGDFAWRAPVQVPAGASLVRVELPADALARQQVPNAADVRVFNAAGEAVPFAWIAAGAPANNVEEKTGTLPALPLYTLPPNARKPPGAVQVRVGGDQPVWVRVDGAPAAEGSRPLDAVLFDTRALRKPLSAIDLEATLPANTPVRIAASVSKDLAQWTPVAVRGRVYRFEGNRAPVNLRLAFDPPVAPDGRYLRLEWAGQPGVAVSSINGVLSPPGAAPKRVRVLLPAPYESTADSMMIATGFRTPLAGLAIATPRDNTLVPLRILGRNDDSQPWVVLGQTVVYRLGSGPEAMTNPAVDMHGASVRQLRIVSTNGAAIAPAQLQVHAEFVPPQLAFLASGAAPFTLAVGRERTEAAALPAATLTGMLGPRHAGDLPLATLGAATAQPVAAAGRSWLPGVANKKAALWAVLLAGIAVLGAVAWSLMRQMKAA